MIFCKSMADKRVIKTRRAIEEAFFNLLEQHNYSDITVDAICEEALCSRSTFYAYFSNKEELLKTLISYAAEEYAHILSSREGNYLQTYDTHALEYVYHHTIFPHRKQFILLLKVPGMQQTVQSILNQHIEDAFERTPQCKDIPRIRKEIFKMNAFSIFSCLICHEVSDEDIAEIARAQLTLLTGVGSSEQVASDKT